ncbi:hypothetical protein NIES4102_43720 (plasmid) [Chondrocystis sp. NIES-4102]|nr:hypothetical protein NIES4102_43720 [Chondrocystis sp. NIES-4102]
MKAEKKAVSSSASKPLRRFGRSTKCQLNNMGYLHHIQFNDIAIALSQKRSLYRRTKKCIEWKCCETDRRDRSHLHEPRGMDRW